MGSFEPRFSFLPSLSKKTVIILYHILIWSLILFTAGSAFDLVAYGRIQIFFRALALGIPVLFLLYLNSRPPELPRKTMNKVLLSLVASFGVYTVLVVIGMFRL